jgi:hypothetical protein
MNKFNINLVKEINTKKMGKKKQIEFTKKNLQLISLEEANDMYHQILEESHLLPHQISIIGLNDERFTTLKGFGDDEFADYFEDEYLKNKSSAIQEKLSNFFNITFMINVK